MPLIKSAANYVTAGGTRRGAYLITGSIRKIRFGKKVIIIKSTEQIDPCADVDIGKTPYICNVNWLYPKELRISLKVNPASGIRKYKEFDAICSFGLKQIVECYATLPQFSDLDCQRMCKECVYSNLVGYPHYIFKPNTQLRDYRLSNRLPYFIENIDSVITEDSTSPSSYVYFISDGEYIKIGTAVNVASRLATLQTSNARKLEVICAIPIDSEKSAYLVESYLHRVYASFRKEAEWFDILHYIDIETFSVHFPYDQVQQSVFDAANAVEDRYDA